MSTRPTHDPTQGFLWKRLRISEGAFFSFLVLIVCMFGIYKIDNDNIQKSKTIAEGVCKVVAGANKGTNQTRARLQTAADRNTKQAKAEEQIASIWRYAKDKQPPNTPPDQVALVDKLVKAQETLAREDRAAASDLHEQAKAVKPLLLQGC